MRVAVFVCLIVLFVFLIINKKNKSDKYILFVLFVGVLSVFSYYAEPPVSWDLYRHFQWLDQIRFSNISLFDFLFNNQSKVGNGNYKYMLFFNLLRWVVVRIGNSRLLPMIAIAIDYTIVSYIFVDWSTNNSNRLDLLTFFISFSFLPYIYALSGIRNGIASCLEALAIYLYLNKDKKMLLFFILSFIACTFHYCVVVAIPIAFAAKYKFKTGTLIIILFSSVYIKVLANLMINSNMSFFQQVSAIYLQYSSDDQYRSAIYPLYSVLYITSLVIIIYVFCGKNEINTKECKVKTFCAYYCAYIISNIGNYDLLLRPAYILGALAPVLTSILIQCKRDNMYNNLFSYIIVASSFMVTIYTDTRYFIAMLSAY